MVGIFSGALYFIGFEISLKVLGKLGNKAKFICQAINYSLCIIIAASSAIITSPYFFFIGKRASLNWFTGRVFYNVSSLLLEYSVEIEGMEHLDKQPYVFIGNHQSMLDLVWLGSVFSKQAVIISKASVKFVPLLGWFMILADDIFISRGNKQSTSDLFKKASEILLEKNVCVFFFPEGTRASHKDGPGLLPFKKGAFLLAKHAKVPIVPMVASDLYNIYDAKRWIFSGGRIKVKILPPIPASEITESNFDNVMQSTWNTMYNALQEISPARITNDAKIKTN
ncbi:hypothetical protein BB561_001150 [Smittium simulii]|uniref:1-acyl-sn-glycerol-3-phosphate acyltransferase n=1 Tax=Smittium simulii TaxID=133385 RepID=A0A2T9YW14_9FUNG|nr:hypothetical protein BB561_001150 [Smittium simulii]